MEGAEQTAGGPGSLRIAGSRRMPAADIEMITSLLTPPLGVFPKAPRKKLLPSRKSLRLKFLRINLWGSIICGEFLSKSLILGSGLRGEGVTSLLILGTEMGKAGNCGR